MRYLLDTWMIQLLTANLSLALLTTGYLFCLDSGLNCRFYHAFRMEDWVGKIAGPTWDCSKSVLACIYVHLLLSCARSWECHAQVCDYGRDDHA